MGNYSQVPTMVWIRGIMLTTQSKSIISPPNKEKDAYHNHSIALKIISRVRSFTNYEGE
jgi:hypothetical protein